MKAKEYFDKYDTVIWAEATLPISEHVTNMYTEFVKELKTLIKARNIKTDRAVMSVIEELNAKWNAISNMFEKKYGKSPIRRNGFMAAIMKQLNEPAGT